MKTCSQCGEVKPLESFHRKASSPDGRRAACKDCRKEDNAANADRERARAAAWREDPDNRERSRRASAARYVRHREQDCARRRAEYWANHDRELRGLRRRYYANPDVYVENNRRRRARLLEATVEDFTFAELLSSWAERGLSDCTYCPDGEYEHADHVVPLSRGGSHSIDNLVPACARCNLSKGAKLLEEWLPGHQARLAASA